MNYIIKLAFFGYIMTKLAVINSVSYMSVIVLLLVAASSVYREKFGSNIILFIAEASVVFYVIQFDAAFSFLYGLIVYDLISSKYYLGVIPIVLAGIYQLQLAALTDFLLIVGLCCIFAYMKGTLENKEALYRDSYDKQREYSYQLEQAKARLISSSEEAAHMAEIKERNRIARQIHDNVGHSMAGILMQLQAARKLYTVDQDKAAELISSSIEALSNALTVMRDTVHNIKPKEGLGIEYLKHVADNFKYCPVEFSASGDFGELPVNIMQILYYNLKEALTNVSKYSQATAVSIRLDSNDRFVRLYIKDNGVGKAHFKEGMGISGMKERVENAGGTISISSENGFLIVCVIPIKKSTEVIL